MTTELKVVAGESYRQRNGHKFRVYATDGDGSFPVHGAINYGDGRWTIASRTRDGREYNDSYKAEADGDLISIWTDPIEMDWSALPKWIRDSPDGCIAADDDGEILLWYAYVETPQINTCGGTWDPDDRSYYTWIPPAYAPKWTGDWRNSLTKVPR